MLVLGIRNQFLIAVIHDPIQVLQRRTQIAPFLWVFVAINRPPLRGFKPSRVFSPR